jgi:hypothetical protein
MSRMPGKLQRSTSGNAGRIAEAHASKITNRFPQAHNPANRTHCFDTCYQRPSASHSHHPPLSAMSTPVISETCKLSEDELILHYHATLIKNALEHYHASATEDKKVLMTVLKRHLVCLIYIAHHNCKTSLDYLERCDGSL